MDHEHFVVAAVRVVGDIGVGVGVRPLGRLLAAAAFATHRREDPWTI
jgi:hypothetical protein